MLLTPLLNTVNFHDFFVYPWIMLQKYGTYLGLFETQVNNKEQNFGLLSMAVEN